MDEAKPSLLKAFMSYLWILHVPSFLLALSEGVVIPVLPLFGRALAGGRNNLIAGAIVSGRPFGQMISDIPCGVATETLGVRTSVVAGGLVMAAGCFLSSICGNVWLLLAAQVAVGLGFSLYGVARHGLVGDLDVRIRGRSVAFMGAFTRAGWTLGPLAGGMMAQRLGLHWPFVLAGIILILTAAVFSVGYAALMAGVQPGEQAGSRPGEKAWRQASLLVAYFSVAFHQGIASRCPQLCLHGPEPETHAATKYVTVSNDDEELARLPRGGTVSKMTEIWGNSSEPAPIGSGLTKSSGPSLLPVTTNAAVAPPLLASGPPSGEHCIQVDDLAANGTDGGRDVALEDGDLCQASVQGAADKAPFLTHSCAPIKGRRNQSSSTLSCQHHDMSYDSHDDNVAFSPGRPNGLASRRPALVRTQSMTIGNGRGGSGRQSMNGTADRGRSWDDGNLGADASNHVRVGAGLARYGSAPLSDASDGVSDASNHGRNANKQVCWAVDGQVQEPYAHRIDKERIALVDNHDKNRAVASGGREPTGNTARGAGTGTNRGPTADEGDHSAEKPVTLAVVLATFWREFCYGGTVLALQLLRQSRSFLLPLVATDTLGLSKSRVGLITALMFAVDTAMFYPTGYSADKFGRKPTGISAMIVLAAGIGLLGFAHNIQVVVVASLVIGLGNGLSGGTMITMGADFAPKGKGRLAFLGVWRCLSSVGAVIGPLAAGVLARQLSLSIAAWCIGAFGLLVSILWVLLVPESQNYSSKYTLLQ